MLEDITQNDEIFSRITSTSCESLNFALLISGGPGLLANNPIQRLYRELTVWLIPRAYSEVIEKIYKKRES